MCDATPHGFLATPSIALNPPPNHERLLSQPAAAWFKTTKTENRVPDRLCRGLKTRNRVPVPLLAVWWARPTTCAVLRPGPRVWLLRQLAFACVLGQTGAC